MIDLLRGRFEGIVFLLDQFFLGFVEHLAGPIIQFQALHDGNFAIFDLNRVTVDQALFNIVRTIADQTHRDPFVLNGGIVNDPSDLFSLVF